MKNTLIKALCVVCIYLGPLGLMGYAVGEVINFYPLIVSLILVGQGLLLIKTKTVTFDFEFINGKEEEGEKETEMSFIYRKEGSEMKLDNPTRAEKVAATKAGYKLINTVEWGNTSKCKGGNV